MHKFLLVVVVATLTACASQKPAEETTADSTATGVVTPVTADTVSADSSVAAPTFGENVK